MMAAPIFRSSPGSPLGPLSNNKLAMRNSGSPRKFPAMPLATWSLMEGRVVSPAYSHSKLPAKV